MPCVSMECIGSLNTQVWFSEYTDDHTQDALQVGDAVCAYKLQNGTEKRVTHIN